MKNWITTETLDALNKNSHLPLPKLLSDSFFYPASGIDGSPIRHANKLGINSFVYVDTSFDKTTFDYLINNQPLRGYHIYGIRELQQSDLIPDGWSPQIPEELQQTLDRYVEAMKRSGANPSSAFARWIIFERDGNLTDEHGPSSLSLLYIRGEAIATYQALYIEQKILPKIFGIIRPGTSFGGNFSNFYDAFHSVMEMHDLGLPEFIFNWHSKDEPVKSRVYDPWNEINTDIVSSSFSKDGEEYFSISLFKKITNINRTS
jgi:hypothetical protein